MQLRRRSVLRGVVQGVGFRPHVARAASRYAVSGFCGNDDESVFIEAQGEAAEVEAFLRTVLAELPPLARVDAVDEFELAPLPEDAGFRIVESERRAGALTLVPPDIARCDDCLRELNDPADRRYRYPFISCTNCGPRFSIIRDVPYDRANTTLDVFPMCAACRAEYRDPLDRRFHAEPIGCWDCGPRLWLQSPDGTEIARSEKAHRGEAIEHAGRIIADGGIVAVKGIGGFTLFADARNAAAVGRLRERKRRPAKPFAVMASSVAAASAIADFSEPQLHELTSPQRPIVLAPMGAGYDLAAGVAPGLGEVGVMLPYAPVHDLLLGASGGRAGQVLIATSGNSSGEPLCYRNEDALRDLAGIADAFLINDRDIHVPVEDSVLIADRDAISPIRRSRGYAPLPIPVGTADVSVLAVGGELKNTFALTRDGLAFVSAHIGDMGSLATQRAFERSVAQLETAHRRRPELIVADLHPSYSTSAWAVRAGERDDVPVLRVQHHHAHALSLIAEHGAVGRRVVCAVFDGTGYGEDGTVWGGELLDIGPDPLTFERVWHLPDFPLPGGDSAVRNPWKSALALLDELGIDDGDLPPAAAAPPAELALVRSQLATGTALVLTTSAGRLFDAVASILGIRHSVSYEAQAAMELERAARGCGHPGHATFSAANVPELVRIVVAGLRAGEDVACLARIFHAGLASVTARALRDAAAEADAVGLTGGVFQNRMLAADVRRGLVGIEVLTHAVVPPNDGGLSLGQALAGYLTLTEGA